MSCKDALQVMIGNELFNRGWRYHKTEKLWVARLPNVNPTTRDRLYEEGEYQYFNKDTWTRDRKRMVLEYDKLATQQQMPTPVSTHSKYSQIFSYFKVNLHAFAVKNGAQQHEKARATFCPFPPTCYEPWLSNDFRFCYYYPLISPSKF